ncbi:cation:proton antiporter domain-containing protein [Lacunimicrobium album]
MHHLNAEGLTVMLLALGLLIGCARALGELARRFHQPAVLGELIAGVLIGPTVFGHFFPGTQGWLFPSEGPNAVVLDAISNLAIVLFLLVAGMEVDLSIVWRQGRSALKIGVLGTFIPFLVGLLGAMSMPQVLGQQADADNLIFSLFLATAMSISALPVIAKTLMDLNLYRTDLGMLIVSAAIFNDVIGWTIFAIILGMMGTHGAGFPPLLIILFTLLFAAAMLTVGRWLIHRILPVLQAYTHWPGGVLGFAVTLALFSAALTEYIGIHAIFGSFLLGVALGASSHLQERTRALIDEFVSFIFAPLFFASIGLRVNFLTHFDPTLVFLIFVIACAGKIGGVLIAAKWAAFTPKDSLAIAFAMNARGAMEIILGLLALEAGIIKQDLFVALVVMAIGTSAISGPLIRWALRRRQPKQLIPHLNPKLFIKDITATTRYDAIRELAVAASQQHQLDSDKIVQLAWARENVAATGIGNGIALPHARLDELSTAVVAVGLSEPGIGFDAPDGQPAHLIFLLLTPLKDPSVQLEISAQIARTFRDANSLSRVLGVNSYTEFLAVLKTLAPQNSDQPFE